MIKQLDFDEIDVETQERFLERLEAWERSFYGDTKRRAGKENSPEGETDESVELRNEV